MRPWSAESAAADGAAVRLLLVGRVDGGDVVLQPRFTREGLAAVVARQAGLVHIHLQCTNVLDYRDTINSDTFLNSSLSLIFLKVKQYKAILLQ